MNKTGLSTLRRSVHGVGNVIKGRRRCEGSGRGEGSGIGVEGMIEVMVNRDG